MDLGTLIGDLGGAYINARFGQQSPPPSIQPALVDIPFVDVVPEVPSAAAGTRGMVWNPNAHCGQGAWQKRYRKRRKRLATDSDIADIAKLKSVLSPAEFKVWLASH